MTRLCALAMALLFSVPLHAAVPTGSIDAFIAAEMEEAGVPGLTYGVADNGQISSGTAGIKSLGSAAPVTEETGFLIGSVSKSFTAFAVMQLVEAGHIDLDAPIAETLDGFATGSASGAITIRQLLSHTSGYTMYQGNLSQSDASVAADALARRVDAIFELEPVNDAGTIWEYSNINYILLGRLIEVVSGDTYADYMATNVYKPAGMVDSFVFVEPKDERLTTGHEPWLFAKRIIPTNKMGVGSAPQGGVVSTGGDMARYLAMMVNGRDDLLTAKNKALMMTPASPASPNYGFGWFINPENGAVYHEGLSPGFEALAVLLPDQKKGVAVLVNGASGTGFGDTGRLRHGLSARVLGLDYNGGRPGWSIKAVYLFFIAAPFAFGLAMIWAVVKRREIRAKRGFMRHVSLWLPLIMTSAIAALVFLVIPQAFGTPLSAIEVFQPTLAFGFVATAITGLAWAILRLILAFTARAHGPFAR